MKTWRDTFRTQLRTILADARARGVTDERGLMRAAKNPYKGGWLAQVWADERARQLGRSKGRVPPRRGSPEARRRSIVNGGQLDLTDATRGRS